MLQLLLRLADRQHKTLGQICESMDPGELTLWSVWLNKYAPEIQEKRQADWRMANLIAAVHNSQLTKWVYEAEIFMPFIEAGPPEPKPPKPKTPLDEAKLESLLMGYSQAFNRRK